MEAEENNGKPKGLKFDQGKNRPMLLMGQQAMPDAMRSIIEVLTIGAQKYDDNNWRYVDNKYDRYQDALLRHIHAYVGGEKFDPETGINHLSHAACNLLFLLQLDIEQGYEKREG